MLAIMVINAERWSENNLFLTLSNVFNRNIHNLKFSFLNYQINNNNNNNSRTKTSARYQIEYVHFQEWSYGLEHPLSYYTYQRIEFRNLDKEFHGIKLNTCILKRDKQSPTEFNVSETS